jgi:putative tryptophan/tyrosine transport system substrate-binding protein
MATLRRRDFVTLMGGTAFLPLAARAQQALPVIGFLNIAFREGYASNLASFEEGLKESGYEDGKNVAIEYRWADGQYDRLQEMAADLVSRRVAVIVANTPANVAAKQATETVPIVFTTAADPVKIGLVSNLSRPGGNVTGVTQLDAALGPKRLELAHELAPTAPSIALLLNTGDPVRTETLLKEAQEAAAHMQLELHAQRAHTDTELEAAFSRFAQSREQVLVIGADAYFNSRSKFLAELCQRHALPAIFEHPEFTEAGGLMSYSGNIRESYRWAGIYAARILKGEKPADLPVQQSTTVELIVNLKTAKALGIAVPLSLLGRADKIIE